MGTHGVGRGEEGGVAPVFAVLLCDLEVDVDRRALVEFRHVEQMMAEGADWIDVGGESTRPGAEKVSIEEELSRILPIIREIGSEIPVSIDTSKHLVAAAAIQAGARCINDVTGLEDPKMVALTSDVEATVVMHSRGTPQNMNRLNVYDNLIADIQEWLMERAQRSKSTITWIDPGIGFAKDAPQSLRLLAEMEKFKNDRFPVYVGASRKSFIGHTIGISETKDRVFGSVAAACMAYERGANAFRVHDVAATRQALDLVYASLQVPDPNAC